MVHIIKSTSHLYNHIISRYNNTYTCFNNNFKPHFSRFIMEKSLDDLKTVALIATAKKINVQ